MNPTKSSTRRYLIALLFFAIALSPTLARAQQQAGKAESVSKVERLNRAPVSKEILQVKFPRPKEFTLSNGLTVLVLEDHRLPTVSVSLRIEGAGGLFVADDELAVAPATMALIDSGTKTRTNEQIAEEQDRLGMTMFGGAGVASTSATMGASGLSDNFDQWFALLSDVLLNPTFPEEELKKYVDRQKASLRQTLSNPTFHSIKWFNKAVYGDHPLKRVLVTPESLDALTPEALTEWHQERYVPQYSMLGIAGDVDADALRAKLEKWLGGWKKTRLKVKMPSGPKPAYEKNRVILVHRPGSVQTSLRMGNLAIDRTDPDYYAATVMNRILGSGPASRLFLNIREAKGYTYGVGSNFSTGRFVGPFYASSNVRTNVTEGAMKEFLYEFKRIRDTQVSDQELEEAKRAIVGGFARALESPSSVLSREVTRRIYGFSADYWDEYPAKIMAVTKEDVQRVAQKYIDLDAMQFVAVGDATQVKAILETYGPVEIYDTDGKPVSELPAAETEAGPPAQVTGEWEMTLETMRGEQNGSITFEQDGAALTGKMVGPRGNELPFTGTVAGNKLNFSVSRQTPRGEVTIQYAATVEGGSMKGTMTAGGGQFNMNWSAKRKQ